MKKFMITTQFVKKFIILIIFVALLHHLDHVLRYDHSGWPFRADPHVPGTHLVTPFTYSLLVYPLLISLLFVRNKAYRLTVAIALAIFVVGAHAFLELPSHQYDTWAHDSSPYGHLKGHPNVLHLASPLVGVLAAGWSLFLDVLALLLPFVIFKERPAK